MAPAATSTGSFWRCPQCSKHVPTRVSACRCGFDRTSQADTVVDVRTSLPAPDVENGDGGVRWSIVATVGVITAVLAASTYIAFETSLAPAARDSALAQRLRASRERPVVNHVIVLPPTLQNGLGEAPGVQLAGPSSAEVDTVPTGLTPQNLFALVAPSIVVIEVQRPGDVGFGYFGSGVVMASDVPVGGDWSVRASFVATNRHVIENATAIRVSQRGEAWPATLVKTHPTTDLAYVSVPGMTRPIARIRRSSDVSVGERAFAIGTPQGLELSFSEGLISAFRRHRSKGALLQTTAPVSSGSSGGGLFDSDGRLIGIPTLVWLGEGGVSQNLNLAVPAEAILEMGIGEEAPTRASTHP